MQRGKVHVCDKKRSTDLHVESSVDEAFAGWLQEGPVGDDRLSGKWRKGKASLHFERMSRGVDRVVEIEEYQQVITER